MTVRRPLGASVDGSGAWFVAASSVAERIEVVLFDAVGAEQAVLDLARHRPGPAHAGSAAADEIATWSVQVEGVGHGQRYGFRVHGPGDPASGHACDPAKLLVDPAARGVARRGVQPQL